MGDVRRDLKVLILSTWLPKPCGIATYSHDLAGALLAADPQIDYRVVAINDPGDEFAYPPVVRHQLAREGLRDQLAEIFPLDVRQQPRLSAPRVADLTDGNVPLRREIALRRLEVVESQPPLFEVVLALDPRRYGADLLHRGEK